MEIKIRRVLKQVGIELALSYALQFKEYLIFTSKPLANNEVELDFILWD